MGSEKSVNHHNLHKIIDSNHEDDLKNSITVPQRYSNTATGKEITNVRRKCEEKKCHTLIYTNFHQLIVFGIPRGLNY